MPVGVIMSFAEGDPAKYDRVLERMQLNGRAPAGCLFHAAGPYEGGWRVVDVWEDASQFERFAEEQIGPHAGAEGLGRPSIEMLEAEESFDQRGSGTGDVSLLQIVRLPVSGETFRDADTDIRDNQQPPDGCMFHINGPSNGGWMVIDAWTDAGARDAFIASKVVPAMQSRDVAPPTIEDLPIHNTLAP
jgi:quinol monooxygenase YgiN